MAQSPSETAAVEPFHLAVPEAELEDLRRRLRTARWPEAETTHDWRQGAPLADVQALSDYWLNAYDWRRCEAMLNAFGQYRTQLDGLGVHFLHVRSPEPDALPLLLTHGWPGSVLEFAKVVGPLSNPVAHGGEASDAFHLIIPSLPGYGFSDKPRDEGWGVPRIAQAWVELVRRLGYDRFVAQGGDWGAAVTHAIGHLAPPELLAIHLNMPLGSPRAEQRAALTPDEQKRLERMQHHQKFGRGYSEQQSTRPQTLGYALADSPVGQAAWIYEKYREWSDCKGDPRNAFTLDEMLDNIMLYWLPNAGASSARLYWESLDGFGRGEVTAPVCVSSFPCEIFRPTRKWVEARYPNIAYWNELDRGGHFAAFEVPELFVGEMRAALRPFRAARRS
jgi:pimeloyl-ACP methyl ester carboxylesterase